MWKNILNKENFRAKICGIVKDMSIPNFFKKSQIYAIAGTREKLSNSAKELITSEILSVKNALFLVGDNKTGVDPYVLSILLKNKIPYEIYLDSRKMFEKATAFIGFLDGKSYGAKAMLILAETNKLKIIKSFEI